jgi:hypothetical protein
MARRLNALICVIYGTLLMNKSACLLFNVHQYGLRNIVRFQHASEAGRPVPTSVGYRKKLAVENTTTSAYDYGFASTNFNVGEVLDGTVPPSAIRLGVVNFRRELKNIVQSAVQAKQAKQKDSNEMLWKLSQLKLSNGNIWARERARPQVKSPLIIKVPYLLLCFLLDYLFDGIPLSRFYFLEVVARMPYFSYITMLHTYETLGWWRRSANAKRVHFAEELNEYHHLLIWESLGGDQEWRVRFLAQHSAILYYFGLILLWVLSPTLAYNFSELL